MAVYIINEEGGREEAPELIGPFIDGNEAAEWGNRNLAFETFWIVDTAQTTDPMSSAFEVEEES